jgi:hypothetical protein
VKKTDVMDRHRLLFLLVLLPLFLRAGEAFHPSWLKGISDTDRTPDALSLFGYTSSEVRALYLNRHTASPSTPQFRRALRIIAETPMNALVIDMKNVKGDLSYRSALPEVRHTRASRHATIRDIRRYVRRLKGRGVYLIARIAVFKDKRQALAYPSRAVRRPGGGIWRDRHGEMWVDPFDPKARAYTLAIAEEVARLGFDEINFDYIRFPAHRGLRYDRPDTRANRVAAIDSFLQEAENRLHPLGVKVSVDVFGYVLWNPGDLQIGQVLEKMARHVDYICPMLYPSGFYRGSVTFSNPAAHPYEIVRISLKKGIARGVPSSKFRPWLQSFRDYAYSRHQYREHEIAAQIRAAEKLGASGWLLWNPSSRFPYVNRRLFVLVGEPSSEDPSQVAYAPRKKNVERAKSRQIHRTRTAPLTKKKNPGSTPHPLDILRGR